MTIIPYDKVDFVWIKNHYDIHLKGLCRYNGELCEFETDYPDTPEEWNNPKVFIKNLTWYEKLRWLINKKLFEWCVGYHWSYPQRLDKSKRYFKMRRPKWLFKILFDTYYGKYNIFRR